MPLALLPVPPTREAALAYRPNLGVAYVKGFCHSRKANLAAKKSRDGGRGESESAKWRTNGAEKTIGDPVDGRGPEPRAAYGDEIISCQRPGPVTREYISAEAAAPRRSAGEKHRPITSAAAEKPPFSRGWIMAAVLLGACL